MRLTTAPTVRSSLTATTYGTKGNIALTDQGVLLSSANTVSGAGINAVAAQVDIGGGTPATFTGGQMGNDGLTLTDMMALNHDSKMQLPWQPTLVQAMSPSAPHSSKSVLTSVRGNLSIGNFSSSAQRFELI
ncbi:MAG: hypothetical protein R2688_10165 [Fimbriimonadaceae bacterium]